MQENENVKTHKVIIVATIMGFITSFEMNNIKLLQQLGYQVSCAANLEEDNHPDKAEILKDSGVKLYHIPFSRSPFTKQNIRAYKELRKLMREEHFDLIHCHTPVGGVLGRMAAHKEHVPRIIYTAHGFHFYDGAPLKNWLIFYPIEKYLSRYTDVLITINKEDYNRATEKFHAKKTAYVPGVGIDIEKFAPRQSGRERIRAELGLKDTDTMILSVGELNENKNHASVIKALSGSNLTYVVVGKGDKEAELNAQAKEYAVDLRLTGYRNDVADFYDAADAYILPSIREGLNVSLMEAMASGLPAACGRIRGNVDLIDDEDCLFNPTDVNDIKKAIQYVLENKKKLGQINLQKIKSFDLSIVKEKASEIYAGGAYEHLRYLLRRQKKRREMGVPLDAKLLISIGELSARKNHKVAVEALHELPENYWYIIIGKGSLKDELESIDHTGRLRLLGYRTDIAELLQCSDMFVFPSLQEGLPVALMEAMASGLPVACSKIRGNVDLIDDDDCLFKPTDAKSIEKAIQYVLSQNSSEMAMRNLEAVRKFSLKEVAQRMEEIYRQGIDGK